MADTPIPDAAPAPLIMQGISVKGISVLCLCSDGSTRAVMLTQREGRKLVALLTHQVCGGVLRLSAQPVKERTR